MLAGQAAAQRPIIIAGGGGWTPGATPALASFAEAFSLPVALAFRRQDALDNRHPCYIGHVGIGADPALIAQIEASVRCHPKHSTRGFVAKDTQASNSSPHRQLSRPPLPR